MIMLKSDFRPILTIAAVTALEGYRTKLLWLVAGVLLVGVALAGFGGTLAVTEGDQIQSAMLGAWLRLSAVLVTTLFVLNGQVREFNDKGLELVLSLPIPRASYYFGKLTGYIFSILPMVALFTVTLLFYAPAAQVGLWGFSLLMELILIVALSLLCLFTFNQVPPAFSMVLAVYLLARSITSLQLVGHGPIMPGYATYMVVMNGLVDGIAYLLPGLDRFTRTEWLVYGGGGWADAGFVAGQGLVYLVFLSGASLIDLYRKNF